MPLSDTDAGGELPGRMVVDLGLVSGSGGAIWSLPHGGDLDANLVRLGPDESVGAHINNDVDVLVFVQSGSGWVTIDDIADEVGPDHLVLIPRGAERSILATGTGMTYLSVHRRRTPLGITTRT